MIAAPARHELRLLAVGAVSVALLGATGAAARAARSRAAPAGPIVVSVDETRAGASMPARFLGLSMDTPTLAMAELAAPSPVLANLLDGIGPGLLRISGDMVDRTEWLPAPAPAAPWSRATLMPQGLGALATLASATGWQVLLGLNLGHPLAAAILEEARTASTALGASLAGIAIGNEPDLYTRATGPLFRAALGRGRLRPRGWRIGDYEAEVTRLRSALLAGGVAAPLYGPETATSRWLEAYAGPAYEATAVLTSHVYPLSRCAARGVTHNGPRLAALLSARVARHETAQIRRMARIEARDRRPLRIDELGSVSCAGRRGTSDTFAAALWALNAALIAAREGIAGVNFTSGLGPCEAGGTITAPWYSPICTVADGQLTVRPQYYALALLRSLQGSTFVRVEYAGIGQLAVFALRAPDGALRVVIDNMTLGARGRRPPPATVLLRSRASYATASVLRLTAPSAAATTGATLGGAAVGADGTLQTASGQPLPAAAGSYAVAVPAASAAVVTLSPVAASAAG